MTVIRRERDRYVKKIEEIFIYSQFKKFTYKLDEMKNATKPLRSVIKTPV